MSRVITNHGEQEPLEWEPPVLPGSGEHPGINPRGYDDGFARGHQEGLAAGRQMLQEQFDQFRNLMASFTEPLAQLDREVEEQLAGLAAVIARQVIRRELVTDPECIQALVREAIDASQTEPCAVTLRLHPDDAELVRSSARSEEPAWQVLDDPEISRGGCIVDTKSCSVDATIEARLEAVIASFPGSEQASGEHD